MDGPFYSFIPKRSWTQVCLTTMHISTVWRSMIPLSPNAASAQDNIRRLFFTITFEEAFVNIVLKSHIQWLYQLLMMVLAAVPSEGSWLSSTALRSCSFMDWNSSRFLESFNVMRCRSRNMQTAFSLSLRNLVFFSDLMAKWRISWHHLARTCRLPNFFFGMFFRPEVPRWMYKLN